MGSRAECTRDLMLLCWSGLNSVCPRQNKVQVAHPYVKASSARAILQNDLGAPFAYLHADAFHLADFIFEN